MFLSVMVPLPSSRKTYPEFHRIRHFQPQVLRIYADRIQHICAHTSLLAGRRTSGLLCLYPLSTTHPPIFEETPHTITVRQRTASAGKHLPSPNMNDLVIVIAYETPGYFGFTSPHVANQLITSPRCEKPRAQGTKGG